MRRIFPLFVFLVTSLTGIAQENDSLVYFDELVFVNSAEESAFNKIHQQETPDRLTLFCLAAANPMTHEIKVVRDRFLQHMTLFENEKFNKATPSKKIKTIQKKTKTEFLTSYNVSSYFNDLLSSGLYNEVSTAALYSLILHRLEIPLEVYASYDRVYVKASPEYQSAVLEGLDPMKSMRTYDNETRTEFISYLINSGQITEEEVKERTIDDLFKEYFYKEENIGENGLAASLYLKKAGLLFEKQLYKDAMRLAEKSYFLYPRRKAGHLMLSCIAMELNSCNYTDIEYASWVYKAARFTAYGITEETLRDEFIKITHLVLISRSDEALYDQYYNEIVAHLPNEAMRKEINFVYNYERGRILQNEGKMEESLPYVKTAYHLMPTHADAKNMFINALIFALANNDNLHGALLDMESYSREFPELDENNNFNTLKLLLTLGLCVEDFNNEDFSEGLDRLQRFEMEAGPGPLKKSLFPMDDIVTEAYSLAASYYFRQGNYSKAKHCLEQGLSYAPTSWELKDKLRAVQ